jgi:SAM-dependent methyltransferase
MTVNTQAPAIEFDRQYAVEQLRRSRHPVRRFIKGFYLRNMLRDVRGPTIDFGCGAGQLLARLPTGSAGLELNQYLIEELRKSGLTVLQAQADMNDFELRNFEPGRFSSLVIAHVMEHLPDPAEALRVLLQACIRLHIERVVIVVPGQKGFSSDHTHKTFIDKRYVETNLPARVGDFVQSSISYFPGPWEWIGRYFIFHEMKIVYDRQIEQR